MNLRAPAVPLITVDPYFSIWSMADKLNESDTKHWTGKPHRMTGTVLVDGKEYVFMGIKPDSLLMEQTKLNIHALSSQYEFACDEIRLTVTFTTPLLLDDLKLMSRPVSYIHVTTESNDGKKHDVTVAITVDGELCQNLKYEFPTVYTDLSEPGFTCGKVGSSIQHPLTRSGDDLRINWGYVYLASNHSGASVSASEDINLYGTVNHAMGLSIVLDTEQNAEGLFAVGYDDIKSIEYFHEKLDAYWRKDGETIEEAIKQALNEYDTLFEKCERFAEKLYQDASASGSEKYADLVSLAYRQAIAAHKIVAGPDGEVLFISKENFSNGCAATLDVTYPSIPQFLLYNPELVKGMLRPIFKYASTDVWHFDFAPHDVGTYPLLNGQVYSNGTTPDWQMPVEECGNMLICAAAVAIAEQDVSFAQENWGHLETWCQYLIQNGIDPDNQLCTDDFAGHLAHNCNLSLKAIMGIASFSILNRMAGNEEKAEELMELARSMAEQWKSMAANDDGTFRLAFDRPGSFSMKYNAIWDKIFGLNLFPEDTFKAETQAYIEKHSGPYGLMLDNRNTYTKSDWIVWSAALCEDKDDFNTIVDRLWLAYDQSESRVPMTDWYQTTDAKMVGFQNRSVQGGLFIKLLMDKEICKLQS
ncbi:glutaminase domain-containing protein [Paenibacillus favisporus]|uniref:glutaminase domain-containing protein n=1 Tax=Paenibacillus favisporus TaxID=221028 RepID=UPI003D2AE056